jgi:hypothetical protein
MSRSRGVDALGTLAALRRRFLCKILHADFPEKPSLLKNSPYARSDPRLGPKHTAFGLYWSFWSPIRSHFQLSSDFFNRLRFSAKFAHTEFSEVACPSVPDGAAALPPLPYAS